MIRGTAHRPLQGIARRRTTGLTSARITDRDRRRPHTPVRVLIHALIRVLTGRPTGRDHMMETTAGGIPCR